MGDIALPAEETSANSQSQDDSTAGILSIT